MDRMLNRETRRRLPLGFAGAIAMIVAVEWTIDRQKMATYGGSQWAYEVARVEADSGDRACKILCFGDSLLKQGLAPNVMEAKAGLRAYNFAVAGGQAPGDYLLFKRALESGARPDAVVLELFPRLMATGPTFNIENWPIVASPGDCLELSRACRSPSLLADLGCRELFPSVRNRNSIRANLLAALNGSFAMFTNEILSARRNWEVNRGAAIEPSRPGQVEALDRWMAGYFPKFECDRANRAYIKKFLELANHRQIPVFWVLPPYQPTLQARCEQSGFDSAHEAFIRGFQSRYPGLHVIDGRHANFDPSVFTDLHHLGREGAAIFSADVARVLRNSLDHPKDPARWLTLSEFRPEAAIGPIEDMGESRRKVVELAAKDLESRKR